MRTQHKKYTKLTMQWKLYKKIIIMTQNLMQNWCEVWYMSVHVDMDDATMTQILVPQILSKSAFWKHNSFLGKNALPWDANYDATSIFCSNEETSNILNVDPPKNKLRMQYVPSFHCLLIHSYRGSSPHQLATMRNWLCHVLILNVTVLI